MAFSTVFLEKNGHKVSWFRYTPAGNLL